MTIANWHLNEWPVPVVQDDKPVYSGYVTCSDGSVVAVLADTLEAFNDSIILCPNLQNFEPYMII